MGSSRTHFNVAHSRAAVKLQSRERVALLEPRENNGLGRPGIA
jgi:hypothetical protein